VSPTCAPNVDADASSVDASAILKSGGDRRIILSLA
jgi:hypothetical protein